MDSLERFDRSCGFVMECTAACSNWEILLILKFVSEICFSVGSRIWQLCCPTRAKWHELLTKK